MTDETAGEPRIRYMAGPSKELRDKAFEAYLFPLDEDPQPLEPLEQTSGALPSVLAEIAKAFLRNLEAVVAVGTLPYQMARAAVAQRRFDALWLAEQIRARQHVDASGQIPEWALQAALEKAKQKMRAEVESPAGADQMLDHILATLSEDLTNDTFGSACEELLRQTAVLTWGALEVLAKDLFVVWLNRCPQAASTLAKDERTKKRFQLRSIPIDLLEQFEFDLSRKMGNLLLQFHDLSDLAAIRDVFDVLCLGDSAPRTALAAPELWMLYQARHLVVHRRGVVDQTYRDNTGHDVAIGAVLKITPKQVEDYYRFTVRAGVELLRSAEHALRLTL